MSTNICLSEPKGSVAQSIVGEASAISSSRVSGVLTLKLQLCKYAIYRGMTSTVLLQGRGSAVAVGAATTPALVPQGESGPGGAAAPAWIIPIPALSGLHHHFAPI